MRIKLTPIWVIFFLIPVLHAQQSPSWSSFYESGFIWNPALTARWNAWEATTTLRQEWVGFVDAPTYGTVGFQYPFTRYTTRVAVGGYIDADQVGPYQAIGVGGTYAYKIYPRWFGRRDGVLTLGLGAAVRHYGYNPGSLTAFDGIEGDLSLLDEGFTAILPDIQIGAFYNSVSDFYAHEPHFYFGIAASGLVPLGIDVSPFGDFRRSPHLYAHGGYRYKASRRAKSYIEPSIMVSYAMTGVVHVMGHMRYEQEQKYWLGLGGVTKGEVFGQVGLIFNDRSILGWLVKDGLLRIGTKVDYHLGSIRRQAGMGYEAFVSYAFSKEGY